MITSRLFLAGCLLAALLGGGCMFSKKSAAPKDDTGLAAGNEAILMQRSVDKRTAELVAQGMAADAARAQATAEFKERYGYTSAAKK